MNPEEARNVLWLPNKRRSLGELLDEGYLNQSRLEWAAKKAFDPALKQAAQVLLESKKHLSAKVEEKRTAVQTEKPDSSLPIGITLEKARATPWPFPPYKGQPMGELVESKQLSLKDLGFAIENAWEEKVRQAASALLLVRLGQIVKEPAPSAGFVHVISSGRSFSERRQLWLTLLEGMVLGTMFALAIFMLILQVIYSFRPHPNTKPLSYFLSSPAGVISLALALGIMLLAAWLAIFIPGRITKKLDKQIELHRLGEEGEEKTVQMIIQALDGNWTLFRNVSLPGRNKGDLDIILVGPPGVWVLEVKNFRGEYRNIGETWEYRHGRQWKAAPKSPSRQASNNAVRLANFLRADNLKVFVNPAVVWVNEESSLLVENPSVAVWSYNRLPDELGNIWQGEKLSDSERRKIAEKLNKLCEAQKKAK